MTLREAADQLGLASPATLRQQIAAGKMRAEKRGRDWHVSQAAVDRYRRDYLGRRGRPQAASG